MGGRTEFSLQSRDSRTVINAEIWPAPTLENLLCNDLRAEVEAARKGGATEGSKERGKGKTDRLSGHQ